MAKTIDERLAALEESNSFVTIASNVAQTVAKDWVTLGGFNLGPQNFETKKPDVSLAADGNGILVNRAGRYFVALNCQLSNPSNASGTGYFEPALFPVGICRPTWAHASLSAGHDGITVPGAMFAYAGITPGKATHFEAPCLAGDILTGYAKFSTANGTDTIDVRSIMYAIRVGGK